jgi:hypothetical protein
MKSKTKYVWLKPDGSFSNSWSDEEHSKHDDIFNDEDLKKAQQENWRLIKYECKNDDDFEFYNMMKLR